MEKTNIENIKSLKASMGKIQNYLRPVVGMLKKGHPPRAWDSPEVIAENLKWHIAIRKQWAVIREEFSQAAMVAGRLTTWLKHHTNQPDHNLNRHVSSGGWDRSGTEGQRTINRPARIDEYLPPHEDYLAIRANIRAWVDLQEDLFTFYGQTAESLRIRYNIHGSTDPLNLPTYPELKKNMPLNGRVAYSVLLACLRGEEDNRYPRQHELFGWAHKPPVDRLSEVIQSIDGRAIEKKGKAPSIKRGRELFKQFAYRTSARTIPVRNMQSIFLDSSGQWTSPEAQDRYNSRSSWEDRIAQTNNLPSGPAIRFYGGNPDRETINSRVYSCKLGKDKPCLPSFILDILRNEKALRRNKALCEAIMDLGPVSRDPSGLLRSYQGSVFTVVTGRPELIGQDVYWADAEWDFQGKRISGKILLRTNWPDTFHIEEPVTMGPAELIAQAHLASSSYFKMLADEKERALSHRQRIARILRALRQLPIVTREDSYRAGNCVPGTTQFMVGLGLNADLESISGRQLAINWCKANYPQYDRFSGVVKFLCVPQCS